MYKRQDLNTEAAWAIVVFALIMYYKIKTNGILSYLKGLLDPIFIMAPINVPVSYTHLDVYKRQRVHRGA